MATLLRRLGLGMLVLVVGLVGRVVAAEPVLKPGDRVAIIGDSITEQKQYSRFIEYYLLACQPELKARVMQFGWSGETAGGFARRLDNDLLPFKPTVATTCYGMNDGRYTAYTDTIGKAYAEPLADIVKRLTAGGVRVVVGSPGAVDTYHWRKGTDQAPIYNDNLAKLSGLARDIATTHQMPFANVHDTMIEAMAKGKAELGAEYDVCGTDGVHPRANGHLAMAYAFLKAMGFTGDLGSIAVDLKGRSAAAGGHTVVSAEGGKLELASTRYIFCFTGGDKDANGTRSILPFLPFNQDLNRLTLTVKNLGTERAKVTWGKESREFTRAQLEAGINLAAEFLDNPFVGPAAAVEQAIGRKQQYETVLIKQHITKGASLESYLQDDPEAVALVKQLQPRLWAKTDRLHEQVLATLTPVRHTLLIEPITP
jgi:lysophospholipase L1-like esterase